MHNVIKSHAKAYHLYRKKYHKSQRGRISIALDSDFAFPNPDANATAAEGAEMVERYMQFQVCIDRL